ncbi:hypothetical protein V8G69_10920 [Gaetbulibacter sp. M235]|uniref:hypothetical protein n=1 Tax=Gaetbulibacter sp. M235 TaxID=3126510 RepID=UPI00374E5427
MRRICLLKFSFFIDINSKCQVKEIIEPVKNVSKLEVYSLALRGETLVSYLKKVLSEKTINICIGLRDNSESLFGNSITKDDEIMWQMVIKPRFNEQVLKVSYNLVRQFLNQSNKLYT